MSRFSVANVQKTVDYLHRNGFKNTCYAIGERLMQKRQDAYRWEWPAQGELERQRQLCSGLQSAALISIVVPCYRTQKQHLLEMIESVRAQTYPLWELILADATEDDSVGQAVRFFTDSRIRYLHLPHNRGIAENTNWGVKAAAGDYIGLLDHDDLLSPEALFWMAMAIEEGKRAGAGPVLLYSDEDKCSGDGTAFFEPNRKEKFNLDFLLSNNYICHFMLMERQLMQELLLRQEYDGAQDYDLLLRAAGRLMGQEERIVHVPRILYHWRCHASSTAENPQSKRYAYEAGRRALQDFADSQGWRALAKDTAHLGFYRLDYGSDLFAVRKDVGAVGGPLFEKGRLVGGRLGEDGSVFYQGLRRHYSGYLHRALLSQDGEAVDIRNLRLRKEARGLFEKAVGVPWTARPGSDVFDVSVLPSETDLTALSLALGRALKEAGYRILYLPGQSMNLRDLK